MDPSSFFRPFDAADRPQTANTSLTRSASARPAWDPRLDFLHPRYDSSRGFVPGAATPWQAPSPLQFRAPGHISFTQALPTATRPSFALSALGLPLPTAPSRGGGRESNRTFPHPGHSLTGDSYRSIGLAVPQVSDSASPTGMGCWHSSAFGPSALPTPRPPVPGVGPLSPSTAEDLFTGAEPLYPSWGGEGLPGWRDGGSSGFPTLSPSFTRTSQVWQPAGPTLIAGSSCSAFQAPFTSSAPPPAAAQATPAASFPVLTHSSSGLLGVFSDGPAASVRPSLEPHPVPSARPCSSPAPDRSVTGSPFDGSVHSEAAGDSDSLPAILATLEGLDPALVVSRTRQAGILTEAEALSRATRPADRDRLMAESPLLSSFFKAIGREIKGFESSDGDLPSSTEPLSLGPKPLRSGQFLSVTKKRLRPFPKPSPPMAFSSLPDSSLKITDTERNLLPSHEGKSSPALVATLPDRVLSEWEELHRLALESSSMAERFIDTLYKDTRDALPNEASLTQDQASALLLASSSCVKATLHALSRAYMNTILARRDALLSKARARIPSAEKDALRSLPLDPAGLLGPKALLSPALRPPSESNAALLEVAKALKSASPRKPPPPRRGPSTPSRKRSYPGPPREDSRRDRAPAKRYKGGQRPHPHKKSSSHPKPSSSKSAVSPP